MRYYNDPRGMGDGNTSLGDAMGVFRWVAFGFAALMLATAIRRAR